LHELYNWGVASSRRSKGSPAGLSVPAGAGPSKGGTSKADARHAKRAEAVAAMRREQAQRQRRGRLLAAGGVLAAVVIVVAAVIVVGLNHKNKPAATTAASSGVIQGVTSVPAATFDKVGTGSIKTMPGTLEADPLTADGKPRILYVGAEYCPFCAAERWSLVAALARFGTFSGLGQTASTPQDVYPDTPTLSFHGSTYTSTYLSFSGYEIQDTSGKPLDTLPADDQALLTKYDAPPYVSSDGAIPFIDLFGSYVSQGASYSPDLLKGMSHAEVATAMQDPSSQVATSVDAQANVFSAIICQATQGKPGDVCSSSGVQAATAELASGSSGS
jgi:hypothetical protein